MIPSLDNGGFIKGIITYLFFLLFIPPLYKTVTGWFTLQDRLLLLGIFCASFAVVLVQPIPLSNAIIFDLRYRLSTIFGMGCVMGLFFINRALLKRSEESNITLGKLKGFRNFLITAEKEKLEMLVAENPSYFYDIIPYTYALGVSDIWIKKFETMGLNYSLIDGKESPFASISFKDFLN